MKWPAIVAAAWTAVSIAAVWFTSRAGRTLNRTPTPPEPGDLGYEEARAMLDGAGSTLTAHEWAVLLEMEKGLLP